MTDDATSDRPSIWRRGGHRVPIRWTRWLAGCGAAAAAAALGLALTAQVGAAPACAAPPVGGTTHQGKATFYDSQGQGGNCSFGSAPTNRMYVALGPNEYAAAAACGGYLDVTGPRGSVRVIVMDQCPECPTGHIDLSREAFARIADPVQGIVPVSYRAVVDPPVGPLAFRIKEGASQWWFAVRVTDHGNPLASVQARIGSGWRTLVRQDYNYWLADDGLGPGPYTLRVTDVYGNQAVASGIRMAPEQVQTTDVRLYGAGAGAAGSGSASGGSGSADTGSADADADADAGSGTGSGSGDSGPGGEPRPAPSAAPPTGVPATGPPAAATGAATPGASAPSGAADSSGSRGSVAGPSHDQCGRQRT
ncbi:expansin EXLX1 family cellulose-binding protein [Solwaraspora sp. WMMB335]|uniref:expansin EXLX1 family cellulose-binding protein n=1 Tax=Solwaraspora sp. WMMB335 TaxID=3404118 RepID=UPI003B9284A0